MSGRDSRHIQCPVWAKMTDGPEGASTPRRPSTRTTCLRGSASRGDHHATPHHLPRVPRPSPWLLPASAHCWARRLRSPRPGARRLAREDVEAALMAGLHPKTWADGVMPLDEFPTDHQLRIAAQVASPTPPHRWLYFEGGKMESRAWYEWHWARGKKLKKVPAWPAYRPKIPVILRLAVYERDGHVCLHCGATENLSLDHIHPFSRGGKDTFDNLQTLCRSCNSRKGARI